MKYRVDPYHQLCRPVTLVSANTRYMWIFEEVSAGGAIVGQRAMFSVFGGCFFGNFRDKASVIMQDMQSLVGFSVISKCMTVSDSEQLFHVKFRFACSCEIFNALLTVRIAHAWEAAQKDIHQLTRCFFAVAELLVDRRFTAVCRQRPTRKPCCGRETARCHCKFQYLQRHSAVLSAMQHGFLVQRTAISSAVAEKERISSDVVWRERVGNLFPQTPLYGAPCSCCGWWSTHPSTLRGTVK